MDNFHNKKWQEERKEGGEESKKRSNKEKLTKNESDFLQEQEGV